MCSVHEQRRLGAGEQFIRLWWRSHPSVCPRSIPNRWRTTLTLPCPPDNRGIWARVQRPRQTSNVVTTWLRRDLAPYYVLGFRKWLALLIAWTQGHCCHQLAAVVTWPQNPVRLLWPWRWKVAWPSGPTSRCLEASQCARKNSDEAGPPVGAAHPHSNGRAWRDWQAGPVCRRRMQGTGQKTWN
jgi:hypothetical protein